MSEMRTVKKRIVKKSATSRPRHKSDLVNTGKPKTAHPYYCGWCYTSKPSTNHRCTGCGSYMTTSLPQSQISHVYVEDIPAA